MLALAGDFVPFAVNVAASEASETVRPFLPLAERLGAFFAGLGRRAAVDVLEVEYQGQLADYDTRILTLSVLKGLFGDGHRGAGVLRQRAAARRGARRRGAGDEDAHRPRLRQPRSPCAAATTPSPARWPGSKGEHRAS